MKKIWDWLCKVLPVVWGILWMSVITVMSLALLIAAFQWLLSLVGVM